ncbi:NAD(+) synthase [Miniphocaeibacter massiliensis]|uniref:NAD(+) synthase n=1 Tax=Miniphocaeibacter massiliensis TaxID=2041841 RepID=UPI000C07F8DA|nr:NAD(+) synthase [Miniphocaeibacter massiliensis]
MNYKKIKEDLVEWLREYVYGINCKGVVFGLSGGIDSAVVAALAKDAFGEDALGIIMPINGLESDLEDAKLVSDSLNLKTITLDLTKEYKSFIEKMEVNKNPLAYANIKPRLRMIALYYYAQNNGYLVSGTTNLSEYTIGYSTKYGDSAVDISPLIDFTKTEVLELAKYLGIPSKIIDKKPSAGLWEGQNDEDDLGFTYEELDRYILKGEGSKEIIEKVENMKKINNHKKMMPEKFNYRRDV